MVSGITAFSIVWESEPVACALTFVVCTSEHACRSTGFTRQRRLALCRIQLALSPTPLPAMGIMCAPIAQRDHRLALWFLAYHLSKNAIRWLLVN